MDDWTLTLAASGAALGVLNTLGILYLYVAGEPEPGGEGPPDEVPAPPTRRRRIGPIRLAVIAITMAALALIAWGVVESVQEDHAWERFSKQHHCVEVEAKPVDADRQKRAFKCDDGMHTR